MTKMPSTSTSHNPSAPPSPMRLVSMAKDLAYWLALGRFIEAFASAEIMLFNYLVIISKMKNDIARVFLRQGPNRSPSQLCARYNGYYAARP